MKRRVTLIVGTIVDDNKKKKYLDVMIGRKRAGSVQIIRIKRHVYDWCGREIQ